MPDAKKVGTLHAHYDHLPSVRDLENLSVWRCTCDKEFYVEETRDERGISAKQWGVLDSSPHAVAYSSTDEGEPELGRWNPNMRPAPAPEPEVVVEQPAEATPDA